MPDPDTTTRREAYRQAYQQGRAGGTLQPGQAPLGPLGQVTPAPVDPGVNLPRLKKGGKIKKTGAYKLHKGERVLNARQARRYAKHSRGNISDA